MAIFGAGSTWDGGDEQKDDFFVNENYVIGWDYVSARDLYTALASLKTGDILYLKSNAPGSKTLRVKGIGIVTKSLPEGVFGDFYMESPINRSGSTIKVKWIYKEEFHIQIPPDDGKLTNIRAATFFEEYLPYVQQEILSKLFSRIS